MAKRVSRAPDRTSLQWNDGLEGALDGVAGHLNRPLVEIFAALQASPEGLSTEEAATRRKVQGPNLLQEPQRQRLLLGLPRRFANPLVLVLLFAASIAALTHEQASFLIITTIVIHSVLIDFVQEHRAETAAEALRRSVTLRVRALRDGRARDLPAADLVTGDVVLLSAGNLVPADCRLIEARDLFANEALLTGESYPIEKNAGDAAPMILLRNDLNELA